MEHIHITYHGTRGTLLVASIVEIVYDAPSFLASDIGEGDNGGSLSVLRTFRLLRVMKLARGLPQLQNTLVIMLTLLPAVVNFSLLLFLFMYIFALLGVQFYSNRFHFNGEDGWPIGFGDSGYFEADVPRENFDSVLNALMRVFQVLTGEDWNQLMFMCRKLDGLAGAAYICATFLCGNIVIMTVFVSILLQEFDARREQMNLRNQFEEDKAEDEETFQEINDGGGRPDPNTLNIEREARVMFRKLLADAVKARKTRSLLERRRSSFTRLVYMDSTKSKKEEKEDELQKQIAGAMTMEESIELTPRSEEGRSSGSSNSKSDEAKLSVRCCCKSSSCSCCCFCGSIHIDHIKKCMCFCRGGVLY